MNDEEIKTIENVINRCSECKFATCENCEISWNEIKVIKKLLIKYKLQRKQINDAFDRGWIHKDKIREKIAQLETKSGGNPYYVQLMINVKKNILKKLLEE